MPTTTELDKAMAEHERAERRAAEAREKAERATAIEAERRALHEEQFDRATVGLYDEVKEHELDAAVAAAEARLDQVLADDPVTAAFLELRRAKMARYLGGQLRDQLVATLEGRPLSLGGHPHPDVQVAGVLERMVEKRGSELAHEELGRWWEAREAATGE
jgi:hypothetical protein